MKATETTVIDGVEYSITQLPARRGLEMFSKIAGIMSPAALEAFSKSVTMEDDVANLAPIGIALFSHIKPGELTAIADELFYAALINGKPLNDQIDIVFQGRILSLLKLLVFAIKVNFYDFFDGLAPLLKKAKEKAEAASQATTT